MGFIESSSTDAEPAKCTPIIAQQLERLYRRALSAFEKAYINEVLDAHAALGALQHEQPSSQPPFDPLSVQRDISTLDEVQHSPVNPIPTQSGLFPGAAQVQIQGCEINEIHGHKVR